MISITKESIWHFGTNDCHHFVLDQIQTSWTKGQQRLKLAKLPTQEPNSKRFCCTNSPCVSTCWLYGLKIGSMSVLRNDGSFFQVTILGITMGLRAEVQKAQGFPRHLLKHLRDTRGNTNTKRTQTCTCRRASTCSLWTHTRTHIRTRTLSSQEEWGGYMRCQQLQPGWLPSKARAASTRWDQSRPEAVSGRGMRPGSLNLDLSAKEPSENQNSSAETGRQALWSVSRPGLSVGLISEPPVIRASEQTRGFGRGMEGHTGGKAGFFWTSHG